MGGTIAQTMAARRPERVLSLVSWMSNTGARWRGQPSLRMYPVLLRTPPRDREGYLAHAVWVFSRIGSPGFDPDEENLRRVAGLAADLVVATMPRPEVAALAFVPGDDDRIGTLNLIDAEARRRAAATVTSVTERR